MKQGLSSFIFLSVLVGCAAAPTVAPVQKHVQPAMPAMSQRQIREIYDAREHNESAPQWIEKTQYEKIVDEKYVCSDLSKQSYWAMYGSELYSPGDYYFTINQPMNCRALSGATVVGSAKAADYME